MSSQITVYTKPSCVQCNATYRALDKKGINYRKVDISTDMQAPVVVTADDHWSGFRPDKIAAIQPQ